MPRETKGSSILDHVPIENTVHKENTIKPGPWSNTSKKRPLMPATTRPSFKSIFFYYIHSFNYYFKNIYKYLLF